MGPQPTLLPQALDPWATPHAPGPQVCRVTLGTVATPAAVQAAGGLHMLRRPPPGTHSVTVGAPPARPGLAKVLLLVSLRDTNY